MKLIHRFLLTALIFAAPCLAQNETSFGVKPQEFSRVGTTGWQFLKIPTNARHAAMGDVRSAISHGDANAAFANPASAADVENFEVSFNNMKWVADISNNGVSLVKNFKSWGVIGVNVILLDYGDIIRTENAASTDEFGNSVGIQPILDGLGTFSAYDLAVGLMYSRQITDKLQLGGNLRYIEEKLDDAKTSNWSLDVGTLYYTGLRSLRISMLGRSFGPDAEFTKFDARIQRAPVSVKMPVAFVLGAGYDVLEGKDGSRHKLIVAGEYIKPNDGPDKFNLGGEYTFANIVALRGGYRFNYDELGLTLGAGLQYIIRDTAVKFDYAYLDAGLFGQVNMFSIGIGL